MERTIKHLKQSRLTTYNVIKDLSLEQLCTIPQGFNNSIIWNVGHLAVTQQLLCYGLIGLEMHITDQAFIDGFRKGSQPKTEYTELEWQTILTHFKSLPGLMEDDWQAGKLTGEFESYMTSFGIQLDSIEDAVSFNNIHEGMHFGYILALRRAVNAS